MSSECHRFDHINKPVDGHISLAAQLTHLMAPSTDSPDLGLQPMTDHPEASSSPLKSRDAAAASVPPGQSDTAQRQDIEDPDGLVEAFLATQNGTASRRQRKLVRLFNGSRPRRNPIDGKRMESLLAFPKEMMRDWEEVWDREQREQVAEVVEGTVTPAAAPAEGGAGASGEAQQRPQQREQEQGQGGTRASKGGGENTTGGDKLENGATVSDILTHVRKSMDMMLQGKLGWGLSDEMLYARSRAIDLDLRDLLTHARAEIDSVPFRDVKPATLTTYADACFLLALWQLFRPMAPASGPGRKRRRSSVSETNVRRCRACQEPLPDVQIKVKTRVQGLCVPCGAEAIKFAKEVGEDEDGEPLAAMWALAEQWVEEHRSHSPTPTPVPAQPSAPSVPIDPSSLIEIEEPRREKTIPRAYNTGPDAGSDPWISDSGDGARFIDAVKMLDLALIVAGGGDDARRDLIRRLDVELQRHIRDARECERDFDEFDWPRKARSRTTTPAVAGAEGEGAQGGLVCARHPIRAIDPPSLQAYASREAGSPFILRGYVSNNEGHPRWPALEHWKRAGYLLRRTGRGRIVPVELGGNYTEAGWGQAIVSWQQFLRQAGWKGPMEPGEDVTENDEAIARAMAEDGDDEEGDMCETLDNFAPAPLRTGLQLSQRTSEELEKEKAEERERETERARERRQDAVPVYLAQHGLFRQFPTLESDFSVPDYVYSSPDAKFVPPGIAYTVPPEPLVNVWIGSPGVLSPAHTDPFFNCYVQVLGRKRVWLAPPSVTEHMHAFGKEGREEGMDVDPEWVMIQKIRQQAEGGSDDKEDEPTEEEGEGEGDDEWDDEEDESLFASLMTNTSRLPLLKPGQNVDTIAAKFPDFEKVLPHAMETVLEPGDMLVIPPGWWHAMRQEGDGPGWSISFWY